MRAPLRVARYVRTQMSCISVEKIDDFCVCVFGVDMGCLHEVRNCLRKRLENVMESDSCIGLPLETTATEMFRNLNKRDS